LEDESTEYFATKSAAVCRLLNLLDRIGREESAGNKRAVNIRAHRYQRGGTLSAATSKKLVPLPNALACRPNVMLFD